MFPRRAVLALLGLVALLVAPFARGNCWPEALELATGEAREIGVALENAGHGLDFVNVAVPLGGGEPIELPAAPIRQLDPFVQG